MKVKEKDYEDIYWCIVTDQVPSEIINQYFEDRNFYRYYITRRKQMTQKINIQIFNWGPCVVRMKIADEFKKLLLDEAKGNEQDYTSKLAGILDKETGYGEQSKARIIPHLSQCLGVYDQAFEQYINKKYEKKPEYVLSALMDKLSKTK